MTGASTRQAAAHLADAELVGELIAWFTDAAREFPWRRKRRNPYHALVSEAMLQQTQASRVVEFFSRFIARFPTLESLAAADDEDVLAVWSGLGYYSRARRLREAASLIVSEHDGRVPSDLRTLMSLPGVGRYTAGAISSIVFGEPAPIVDGNVMRVLMRLAARRRQPTSKETIGWAWSRSSKLVAIADRAHQAGAFNEAMMELGATLCTPAAPDCGSCPLRRVCKAYEKGEQDRIPIPKPRPKQMRVYHTAVVVRDRRGATLVQRRSATGLWAKMWQAPTLERTDRLATTGELARMLGLREPDNGSLDCVFTHQTTHRIVRFGVWHAPAALWRGRKRQLTTQGSFLQDDRIGELALAAPHRRILLGDASPVSVNAEAPAIGTPTAPC